MDTIRISQQDLELIKQAFKQCFDAQDHLWLFGSRVDAQKRGGDLDFYIETIEPDLSIAVDKKMAFINKLWSTLGEQKIDVVLNVLSSEYSSPIYNIARETGVKLI